MGMLILFFTFMYIGLFSIGGGLAALPFIQQEAVSRGWISNEEFFNMVAISESTPGPIGINMATFVGYSQYGIFGGIIATIGNVLPSLVIIIIIAKYFKKFGNQPVVKAAFYGLRAAVVGLISIALFDVLVLILYKKDEIISFSNLLSYIDYKTLLFLGIIYVIYRKFKLHPIGLIALGAIFGVAFY